MRRRPSLYFIVAAWAAIIFATSSTFIERRVFINFVKRFIPEGMPRHLWVAFWSGFGIFVVKIYHVAEYALLFYLLQLLLRRRLEFRRAIACGALLAFAYAASDEWHQTFVPGRGGTWVDVVIDSLGISIALVFTARSKRLSEKL
jgi:hypothetical protein